MQSNRGEPDGGEGTRLGKRNGGGRGKVGEKEAFIEKRGTEWRETLTDARSEDVPVARRGNADVVDASEDDLQLEHG